MIIYYNPECSKCKHALSLLENQNCQVEIRNYPQNPPDKNELKELIGKLGCKAEDLVRKSEEIFLEKYQDKKYSQEEWIEILSQNPILIERSIVIDGENAVIGRPPVRVLDLIKKVD